MTRNEALEKIKDWAIKNGYSVDDHDAILRFFEEELKMNHVKEISVPTNSENVYQIIKTFGWEEG